MSSWGSDERYEYGDRGQIVGLTPVGHDEQRRSDQTRIAAQGNSGGGLVGGLGLLAVGWAIKLAFGFFSFLAALPVWTRVFPAAALASIAALVVGRRLSVTSKALTFVASWLLFASLMIDLDGWGRQALDIYFVIGIYTVIGVVVFKTVIWIWNHPGRFTVVVLLIAAIGTYFYQKRRGQGTSGLISPVAKKSGSVAPKRQPRATAAPQRGTDAGRAEGSP